MPVGVTSMVSPNWSLSAAMRSARMSLVSRLLKVPSVSIGILSHSEDSSQIDFLATLELHGEAHLGSACRPIFVW